jgi:hypothetical protein
MDRKRMCVANVQYKKPSADGAKGSKNLLRYLTYRESRYETARYVAGQERWVDHGMGRSVKAIADRCDDLKSEHVLVFSLVINPAPDLIALVPSERREAFVRELTEGVVEGSFGERGLDTGVEYSYCLHHRATDDPQAPGQHNPHTHVVLPGTVYSEEQGGRVPLYFSQNRKVNHIEMLHSIAESQTAELMDRYVGHDWEQRIDALEAVREEQRLVVFQPAHGELPELGAAWSGARVRDEMTSDVGIYGYFDENDDGMDSRALRFRSLISRLPHDEAELLSLYLAEVMKLSVEEWQHEIERIKTMNRAERGELVTRIAVDTLDAPELARDMDF